MREIWFETENKIKNIKKLITTEYFPEENEVKTEQVVKVLPPESNKHFKKIEIEYSPTPLRPA